MLSLAQKFDHTFPAFFRFRQVADKMLITNREGEYLLLSEPEFGAFTAGSVAKDSELYGRLSAKNFLREGYDVERAAEKFRARKRFLDHGPNLHLFIVTLRCNETCVYCHASRANMDAKHTDMTPEIAEKTVDLVLASSNPDVTIEFQGGEPLVNFPVVKHVIEYALEKNKSIGKTLEFTMVSNLSQMDEEKLSFLLDHRVQICTSIDGPAELHDKQRKLPGLSAFNSAARWIKRVNEAYAERGLDPTLYHVEALLTTTRETLPRWKEVVDTYVALGCRALFLRPIDPFGFVEKTGARVEYPRSEYLEFYRSAVDYMIELNQRGVEVLERYAAIFLTKILSGEDPNFLDIRWPAGAGVGQLAYNYDGGVFTCDEGRMLHEMGDDTFLIGDVRKSSYRELVSHP
ncbi:MAG TPA: His-Xaa-Ser system radical SAM maturase HxsB, partial [Polyangiaceae bacterium]